MPSESSQKPENNTIIEQIRAEIEQEWEAKLNDLKEKLEKSQLIFDEEVAQLKKQN